MEEYKEDYIHTKDQKLEWFGEGEWVDEPDAVSFSFLGIKCAIRRTIKYEGLSEETPIMVFGGHLCGYAKVPDGHPVLKSINHEQMLYDQFNIDIHGGLTFAEKFPNGDYWIGFDCAHYDDIIPSMKKIERMNDLMKSYQEKYPDCSLFNPTYKSLMFVIEECKSIAEQLHNQEMPK